MKISESSLSRLWKFSQEHDTGTISAFRSKLNCNSGEPLTKAENIKRSNMLSKELITLGYSVTSVKGTYIENYKTDNEIEVKENSFFVVDIKDTGKLKKDLIRLGMKYEQDSITFAPAGNKDYYLISSNKCPLGYPGSGKVGIEVKLGKPIFGKGGEFHSKINGRPFVFESITKLDERLTDYYPTEIRSFKQIFLNN